MRDRLRWLAVPIAAYLAVTLALPAANAAVAGRDLHALGYHAMWVVLGCALVIASVALASVGRAYWKSVRTRANTRPTPRVTSRGKS